MAELLASKFGKRLNIRGRAICYINLSLKSMLVTLGYVLGSMYTQLINDLCNFWDCSIYSKTGSD